MSGLAVDDLTVEYASGDYRIRPLDGLSFTVGSGELVVLLGPSGSGKTTLLSCLAGILTPTSGTITFADTDVTGLRGRALAAYRRGTVGIVFQAFNLIPSLTARENVEAPLRLAGTSGRGARERAEELLALVDLEDRMGHRPGKLSGGQQQRVAIARALAHDPPLLLGDEPTAHLDHVQVETVAALLRRLAAPGRAVVVATHDERILPLADRVVSLVRSAPAEGPVTRHRLETGAVLFRQGDRSDRIYVVEDGLVQIYRERADGREEPVAVVRPGRYFGELGPLLGLPRSASARALTGATLSGYPPAEFRRRYGGDPRTWSQHRAETEEAPTGPDDEGSDAPTTG